MSTAPRRAALPPRGSLFFTWKKCVITIKGRVNSVSLQFIKMDTRWKHPFTCCVCGPTRCGKTQFVKKFLANLPTICNVRFDRILFYYAEWQEAYPTEFRPGGDAPRIEFREGLPQASDYSKDSDKRKLLILDDLMRESSCDVILDLFTKGSHHKNISVIFITQNIFHKGKSQRDISLNTLQEPARSRTNTTLGATSVPRRSKISARGLSRRHARSAFVSFSRFIARLSG